MDLGIAGRKAIVCASSRGIGRGCAEALAEAGCELIVNGRSADTVTATARDLADRYGVTVTPVAADVSTAEGQAALLAACPEPDILINNNAGPPHRPFESLTRDLILDGVVQNMVTPIELIQAVLGPMRARRFGRIVNVTSLSVYWPILGLDLSSGARAGLTSLLAGVARNVAADNVTINFILPGRIDTDRLQEGLRYQAARTGKSEAELAASGAAAIPAKRFGTADEFGKLCAFLASAHAGYLTGQNFRVDGGQYPSAF